MKTQDTIDNELLSKYYPQVGLSADWINDCYQVTDHMVIFDDTDISGCWVILDYVNDPVSGERHSEVAYSGSAYECLSLCLQADSIDWDCEIAGYEEESSVEDICVINAKRILQAKSYESI